MSVGSTAEAQDVIWVSALQPLYRLINTRQKHAVQSNTDCELVSECCTFLYMEAAFGEKVIDNTKCEQV